MTKSMSLFDFPSMNLKANTLKVSFSLSSIASNIKLMFSSLRKRWGKKWKLKILWLRIKLHSWEISSIFSSCVNYSYFSIFFNLAQGWKIFREFSTFHIFFWRKLKLKNAGFFCIWKMMILRFFFFVLRKRRLKGWKRMLMQLYLKFSISQLC